MYESRPVCEGGRDDPLPGLGGSPRWLLLSLSSSYSPVVAWTDGSRVRLARLFEPRIVGRTGREVSLHRPWQLPPRRD